MLVRLKILIKQSFLYPIIVELINYKFLYTKAGKLLFKYYPLFFSIGLIGLFGYGFFKTIQLPTIIFKKSPYIINILTNFVLGSLEFIILSTASIIFISLITTFYLKIKHKNHKLFFK